MQMSELADACGRDVFNIRDSLESMGLLREGHPTRVAIEHGFAAGAIGDGGREYTQWHSDTLALLGSSPQAQHPDLFTCCTWDFDESNDDEPLIWDCAAEDDNVCADEYDDTEQDGTEEKCKGSSQPDNSEQHNDRDDNARDSNIGKDEVCEKIHDSQKEIAQPARKIGGKTSVDNAIIGTARPGFDAIITTDGACSGNPGPGGWAWVEHISGARDSGGAAHTTNNIMELTALIQALEHVPSNCDLLIRADSQYVINVMTKWAAGWRRKGWKKADGNPVANRELVEHLLSLYEEREGITQVEWVKGHAGDAANELVDSMAVRQSRNYAKR